jgi:hypothetical protein
MDILVREQKFAWPSWSAAFSQLTKVDFVEGLQSGSRTL